MEGMIGEVYIDNADDAGDFDVDEMDIDTGEEIPDEWRQLRDNLLERAGVEVISSHNWTYSETDVIILRECAEITNLEEEMEKGFFRSFLLLNMKP